jgi:acyl carrier protein
MGNREKPGRSEIVSLIVSTLRDVSAHMENPPPQEALDENSALLGRKALIDSVALVTLVVDVEQLLEEIYNLTITLADERAMSQKNSPFRSVQSLADYIMCLIAEDRRDE